MKKNTVTARDILRLALPAIIAGIAEPLISLTDVAVVGNMKNNSVDALAAVGLVGSFLSAIIWTLAQTKTSISSIISQALGADKLKSIHRLVPQVLWINIALGTLLYLVTAPLATFIFSLYDASSAVAALSVDYYVIRALGFPLTLCAFGIFGVFRGLQNTSWAMSASLLGAAFNVALDYALVYGIAGIIPAYGILGAAYASVIAQAVMLCCALYYFYKHTPFTLKVQLMQAHPKLRHHIKLTVNFFIRTAFINIAIFLSYRYATGIDESVTAATHAILMNIWLFFSFFIDGFANAGNAIGGRLKAAHDAAGLRSLAHKIILYGVAVALLLVVLCLLFYKPIGSWFNNDPAVLALYAATFWIVLLMQPVNAVAFMLDGIFKGWGEAPYLRNLLFITTVFFFIPVLLITQYYDMGLAGIWWAFTAWMLGRAGILWIQFYKKLDQIDTSV